MVVVAMSDLDLNYFIYSFVVNFRTRNQSIYFRAVEKQNMLLEDFCTVRAAGFELYSLHDVDHQSTDARGPLRTH